MYAKTSSNSYLILRIRVVEYLNEFLRVKAWWWFSGRVCRFVFEASAITSTSIFLNYITRTTLLVWILRVDNKGMSSILDITNIDVEIISDLCIKI